VWVKGSSGSDRVNLSSRKWGDVRRKLNWGIIKITKKEEDFGGGSAKPACSDFGGTDQGDARGGKNRLLVRGTYINHGCETSRIRGKEKQDSSLKP